MDAFTLLDVEDTINGKMKRSVPNIEVKMTRGYNITLEQDEKFARYVTPLSTFELEEQLFFLAKVNIMHIQRLQED